MGGDAPWLQNLVSDSPSMRRLGALLERAAASDVTILLEGETGTGKSALAEAVHRASPRRGGPFVVVDCGAIPANLLEAELFGNERGAFTGADRARVGAFEEASGGTLFLDEIGELPLEVQPKLLRAIENRTVRRLGSNRHLVVPVRVVAATCRRLRDETRAGRFRVDLFHRLAVAALTVPPLRERVGDIPAIARSLLAGLGAAPERIAALLTDDALAELCVAPWPGNLRELRNVLERRLVFGDLCDEVPPADEQPGAIWAGPYADARRRVLDSFERGYVRDLLQCHHGDVAAAAASARIHRVHLYRLLRRHGLTRSVSE
jgi:two-component system, NtrC family, response regulator GlrR